MTSLACKQALVGRRMNLLAGHEIRVTYQQMQAVAFPDLQKTTSLYGLTAWYPGERLSVDM